TVGWVVELKNLLSVFFYLLAIPAYLRFSGVADGSPSEQNPPAYRNYPLYALALLFYLLALFSKSDTCTLPAAILILIWFKRGRCTLRDILWTLPMFILGAILAVVTVYVEHNMTGIQGSDWQFTLSQKCIIAGKALWFYVYKIFWPGMLLPIYPRWPVAQLGGWEWLYPLAFVFVAAVLWLLQKKIGRGPFAAVAFFVVTLSPVLGFIPYYTMLFSFVADHFQYLACIGLIALAGEFLWYVVHWLPERYGQLYFVAAGAIIVSIGSLTFAQSTLYKSPLDLWQYAHENNPDSFYVTSIYGASLLDAGYVGPALQYLQQADQMYPGYRATESALGVAYMDVGAYELAQKYFILAMEQDPYTTYNLDRAVACSLALRDYSRAIEILRIGLSYNKNYAPGWLSLARLYELTGQHALALQCYQTAVSLAPDYRGASLIISAPASSAPANSGH
ncbi:MAG TPA: tetratricopeptide repeat protein, partial [Phycisphaerae bacterium]|nr:tetratricopeptide repeat protein [Phycisphaerae bacterium]